VDETILKQHLTAEIELKASEGAPFSMWKEALIGLMKMLEKNHIPIENLTLAQVLCCKDV
jgi:hypothetical protein